MKVSFLIIHGLKKHEIYHNVKKDEIIPNIMYVLFDRHDRISKKVYFEKPVEYEKKYLFLCEILWVGDVPYVNKGRLELRKKAVFQVSHQVK